MENTATPITIQTTINAPLEKVWKLWSQPEHITQWNQASDDWHTTKAENDLITGGKFSSRMEAKDGSFGFDFNGIYDQVMLNEFISYTMDDGRKVNILFSEKDGTSKIVETFDPENDNSIEMQRTGWQAILDNFKKYVESN